MQIVCIIFLHKISLKIVNFPFGMISDYPEVLKDFQDKTIETQNPLLCIYSFPSYISIFHNAQAMLTLCDSKQTLDKFILQI